MGLVYLISVPALDILKHVDDGLLVLGPIALTESLLAHELALVLLLHDSLIHVALLSGWVPRSLIAVHLRVVFNVRIVVAKRVVATHFLNKKAWSGGINE